MNWLKSVKFRLTVIYSVVLVVTLATFGWISLALLSSGLHDNLYESLIVDFNRVKSSIFISGNEELPEMLNELEVQVPGSLFIYNVETETLMGNPSLLDDVRLSLSGFTTLGTGFQFKEGLDGRQLCIGPYNESSPGKLLVVTRDSSYIGSTVDQYKNVLYGSVPFALIIAGASGYALANHSLRQVKAIRVTAEGIDPGKLTDRIPVRGNDELGQLSGTLNSAFDRIHGFIDRQRRFTEDATHDLRAPLTNIKAQTSLALERDRPKDYYREALRSIEEDTEQMESMVEDLLTLTSLDTVPDQENSPFDLSSLIEEILTNWEAPCAARGLTLTHKIQPDIETTGEPLDFQRIVDNLLENAVKATSQGGVTFTMTESSGLITITVADTGRGIPPDQLEKIFWRFYRVDRHAEGNGLGLPIVEGITLMYGGRVEVESELGKGSTFTVTLPVNSKT
ncbi:MAG: HAMP domain-containing sensor histidine kinase [Dehalogenimonas sp.]|uniref:histidine kinase n=1 Tax=Candidatus Dehalogenimonas loeffleri TaxID=3127115 RepID=A0ABZ2J9D6_9CHLR|nr:HAMP domain-containing sensor histidine kinase [Dehalogenimonas sp.]